MKTDCSFATSISPYIDGELSAGETECVRRHLNTCAACRERIETLYAMDQQLAAMVPISPSSDFGRIFWQKVDAHEKRRKRWDFREWFKADRLMIRRPFLATAAGVLILCTMLVISKNPMDSTLSAEQIAIAQNLELLAEYEMVSHLDLLENWTDLSGSESTDV